MSADSTLLDSLGSAELPFCKMAGGGNDFAVFDDRKGAIGSEELLARVITTRRLSVGGDGLILLRSSRRADIRMDYYNADGSFADFCANGTRCAARFAFLERMAPSSMTIETGHAIIEASVDGENVTLSIPPPAMIEESRPLQLAGGKRVDGAYLVIGVPHYVIFFEGDDLWSLDIEPMGREIRHHRELPDGANVNFVRIAGSRRIEVRTWERGVEGETLSCGSGVVASSIASVLAGRVEPPVEVLTRSGIVLRTDLARAGNGSVEQIRLTGDARVVYRGKLTTETLRGFDPDWVRQPTAKPPLT
ncbi:MAG TPA: diaminopimelate epimerase [Thermoanaerobaculia bacterium]|nr:diaminopimelate epimerase [Thermoanaerobaculia bacterium]